VAFCSKPLFKSDFDKENTATSAPDIKPEQINKTKREIILMGKEVFAAIKVRNKLRGSGSKIYDFICRLKR
jgi:hypothetical protein